MLSFKRFHNIKTVIFVTYTLIISSVIIIGAYFYYYTVSTRFVSNYIKTSAQLTQIMSSRFDQIVKQVDSLQQRILETESIREYTFDSSPYDGELMLKQRNFEKTIYSMAGYDYGFYHMNILTKDGILISFGQSYLREQITVTPEIMDQIMLPVFQQTGSKYLGTLTHPKLYQGTVPTVSVSRSFSRHALNEPKAMIEILISVTTLDNAVKNTMSSYDTLSNQVIVMDNDGNLIYPASEDDALFTFYQTCKRNDHFYNPISRQTEIVTEYISPYTGWHTLVVTPYSSLVENTNIYLQATCLVGVAALVLMMLLTYNVAYRITAPINKIKDSLSNLRLDNLSEPPPAHIQPSFTELDMLADAYFVMQQRLDDSLERYTGQKMLALHSRMLALQSQMNPHFLYNTLAIISVVAESNQDQQVSQMCNRLVKMLRYIAKDHSHTAFIDEMEYLKNYVELMNIRFEDQLLVEYHISDIPPQTTMPPLVIQPIVENCIKYARSLDRKLIIQIYGYLREGKWFVDVLDNGPGFPPDYLAELQEKIKIASELDNLSTLSLDKIGLVNLYLRLKLLYEEDFVFELKNSGSGACVHIGGRYDEE